MKQVYIKAIVFATTMLLLNACDFDLFSDFKDFQPKVKIVSFEQSGDTTFIRAQILDHGESDIRYAGFCYNGIGNPNLLDIQTNTELPADEYQLFFKGLRPDSLYYFSAFAANRSTYALSEQDSFKIPLPNAPEVPCELIQNRIVVNGLNYPVSAVSFNRCTDDSGNYLFIADCNPYGYQMSFYFRSVPYGGIYTVGDIDGLVDEKNVSVSVIHRINYLSYRLTIPDGGKVYVDYVSNDSIRISFCDLNYIIEHVSYNIKGNTSKN